MGIILLIGFSQVLIAVLFWYIELSWFLERCRNQRWYMIPFLGIFNIQHLVPFIVDIAITLFCVANLGFGGGLMGGVTGLFMSNVISVVIIYHHMKGKKVRLATC